MAHIPEYVVLMCVLGSRRGPVLPTQSGERITKLEDLQDIDELHVVEVRQL